MLVSLLFFMRYFFLKKLTADQCSSLKISLSSQLFSNDYLMYRKSKVLIISKFYTIVCN